MIKTINGKPLGYEVLNSAATLRLGLMLGDNPEAPEDPAETAVSVTASDTAGAS
jgi:hypothetical protein